MEKFPRLLVATEFPPNAAGGGPAVVRQMLKGWPVERLFWWSCLPDANFNFGQKVAAHTVATVPAKLYPHRRARFLKSSLLENFWSPWAANHFRRTVKNFQPEVIWVIPHLWSVPPLAKILLETNLPFHATIQDYMDTNANRERLGGSRANRWARMAEKIYTKAVTRDATSHPMMEDLTAMTGCKASQMLHAGIEAENFVFLREQQNDLPEKMKIAHAGTIIVEKEFEFFISALKKIRPQLSQPVSLEFFGNHSYHGRDWFDAAWMNEHGNLSETQLNNELRQCNWGFSPMALNDNDPRYNRFSFPTKFISYLAAGLPIITLGHSQSSVVKMASQYHVGLCTSEFDVKKLSAELLAALSEPNPKSKYRAEILRCAFTEFDAEKMRLMLYNCLRKCEETSR